MKKQADNIQLFEISELPAENFHVMEDFVDEPEMVELVPVSDAEEPEITSDIEIPIEKTKEQLEEMDHFNLPTDLKTFNFSSLPGAPVGIEIVVEEPEEMEEKQEDKSKADDTKKSDKDNSWAWDHPTFLVWTHNKLNNIPRHSGKDIPGAERAHSFLGRIKNEISKAMRTDFDGILDADIIEHLNEVIEKGQESLEEHIQKLQKQNETKRKKKADQDSEELVKQAQKVPGVSGIVISVPYFISKLARALINGHVSAGHDIPEMFEKLSKKYKLTDREKEEVLQLMTDMGYPIRQDRGMMYDEEVDTTSSDNFDWAANFSDFNKK